MYVSSIRHSHLFQAASRPTSFAPLDATRTFSSKSAAKPVMPEGSASSSTAKSAPSQLQLSALASESETLTLHEVERKLSEDAMQEGAEELLQHARILQRWKRCKKASHKVRDEMLKLGSHWNVARKVNRKKRPVTEVAKDLEGAILKKARRMLQSSVAKPADADEADGSEAKRVRKDGSASSDEKPDMPLEVARCSQMTISELPDRFSHRSQETQVKALLSDAATLLAWQTAVSTGKATHNTRDAMAKLGSSWNVPQKASGKKRPAAEIAADLETEILACARRLLAKTTPFTRMDCEGDPAQSKSLRH